MGRRRFRSARSALTAAIVVASLAFSGFVSAPAANAESTISVRAYPSASCVLTPAQTCPLSISVTNPGADRVTGVRVTIMASADVLSSTSDVSAWYANDPRVESGPVLDDVDVGDVEPGATSTFSTDLALSPDIAGSSWGVVGIDVEADSPEVTVTTARTSVVWAPTEVPAVAKFATIVPLVAPATSSSVLTAAELAALTKPGGFLDSQLSAAATASAVAVDPRIVASVYRRGSSAPKGAVDWVAHLLALQGDSFWLQYADADFALEGQVGFASVLHLSDDEVFGQAAQSTASWWSPTLSNVLWAEPDTLTNASITAATSSAPLPTLIAGSGNLPSDGSPHASVAVGSPGSPSFDATVLDDNFTRAIRAAESATSDEEWGAASNEAAAYLAVIASNGGGHINGGFSRNLMGTRPYRTAQTLSFLASLPWAQQMSLLSSREYPSRPVVLTETPESSERIQGGTMVRANYAQLESYATAAMDTARPLADAARLVSPALSVAWTNPAADWSNALTRVGFETHDYINAVHFGETSNINMVGGQASIPITVVNGQPYDVTVVVHAVPSNPRLTVGADQHVTISSESQGTVKIPVAARVGNGDVDLVLSLSTEGGQPFGENVRVPVSVRADWEGFGLGIMAILFVGLVATGVVRTIRRRGSAERPGVES